MGTDAWFTLIVVVVTLVMLAREIAPPAAVVLAATTVLLVTGVIDEEQAFSGFSNSAPLTVAALYVLARAVEKTGVLGPLIGNLLGNARQVGRTPWPGCSYRPGAPRPSSTTRRSSAC